MDISIDFDEEGIRREIVEATREGLKESVEKEVGDMVCPEHGQKPRIEVLGNSEDDLRAEVHCCCETFESVVREKLAA